MASRPSPNSLIHCAICGEDYSATYKRCPFCGAKNAPPPAPARRRDPEPEPDLEPAYEPEFEPEREPGSGAPPDPDDTYVFDGQDLFDDDPGEDDYRPAYPKGGKRLAEKPSSNPFANAEINWPRVITFACSLVIIIAALVIVFTGIYPKLRGGDSPVANASDSPSPDITQSASPAVTDPGTQATQPGGEATDPGTAATDPGVEDTQSVAIVTPAPVDPATQPPLTGPGDEELVSMSFVGANDADFTLQANESHTITLRFNPASWAGGVTWTSSNPAVAAVDANGRVTNVNTSDTLRSAVITATAGSISLESTVFCRGTAAQASQPPATEPPVQSEPPAQSEPPVTVTQAPPSGGTVTVGQQGTIVGADGGLNVRSGPGTTYSAIATLFNGNTVQVVAEAGDGWYQITFVGAGGASATGYIRGEYISMN